MRREDSVSLTPNDRFEVTMNPRMRRVLRIRDAETGGDLWFKFLHYTSDGALTLRMENRLDRTALVEYLLRHTQMSEASDVCPIPREHTELVVIGVCLRMAEIDRLDVLQKSLLGRRALLMSNLKRDMNRHADQERTVMNPRPPRLTYRRYGRLYWR